MPKSDAFPVDAMVTTSILLVFVGAGEAPPPKRPLVELAQPPASLVTATKLPNSCEFPRVDIEIYSILS